MSATAISESPDASPESPVPRGRLRRMPARHRVKTPTLLQMEAAECGAAALGIVLGHYGRHVPLELLRKECGVSRNGATAAGIIRAARAHGLQARGFQMEADVVRDVAAPFIVFWNFKHFVVIEGFGRHKVYLNDPATGRRSVTYDDFDGSFTGICLQFERTPDLTPGGRPPGSLVQIRDRLSGNFRPIALIVFVSFLLTVLGLALPGAQRVFIDEIVGNGKRSWLPALLGLMAGVAGVTVSLTMIQQGALLRLETKISLVTSSRFVEHLLRVPMDFFSQRQAADLSSRVTANDRVAKLLSRDLATAVVSAVVAIGYAVLLFTTDVELAAIGVGLVCLNLVALRAVARLRQDTTAQLQQDRGKLTAATYNGISTIDSLKAGGREDDYFARWAGLLSNVVSGSQRLGVPTQVLGAIPLMLTTINAALILWVGGHRVVAGAISIGLLVAFQTLLNNFTLPVNQLSDLGTRAQEASADIARIRDVEAYPELPAPPGGTPTTRRHKLSGVLEVESVTFGYSPLEAPLIEDFSLTVHPGGRVALVGSTGSGKSTVARLIAGLLTPTAGDVRIDGLPRAEIDRTILGASVSMVDQDIVLFEGTVRENLTLWDETVPESALIEALRDAALLDVVMSRPGRLAAVIRENGKDLSGGQRQRLEIARALAIDPTLLVLDEATSALDPISERRVHESIRRRGCACVVVAHRLSTIRDCDEILVMESGTVVERGTHEQMRAAGGPYQRLIEAA